MTKIYFSRPLDKALDASFRAVKKKLEELLESNKLMLDHERRYEFIRDWATLKYQKISRPNILDEMECQSGRLHYMAQADHYIFLEEWMDLPECKLDWSVIKEYKMRNHLTLRLTNEGELELAEGLPQFK